MMKTAATAILLVLFTGQGVFGVSLPDLDLEGTTETVNTEVVDGGVEKLTTATGQAGDSATQGVNQLAQGLATSAFGRKLSGLDGATNTVNKDLVDGVVEKEVDTAGEAGDSVYLGGEEILQDLGRKLRGLEDVTDAANTEVIDGVVEEGLTAAAQAGDSTLGGLQQVAAGVTSGSDMDLDYGMG